MTRMVLMGCSFPKRFMLFGLFSFLACVCSPALSQQAAQTLPVVTSAGTPDYPPVAQNARIQGAVKVQASIADGKVTWLQVQDGPPLLWQAAMAYVRTWQFQPAPPASLLVTLQYHIEEVKLCGPQTVAAVPHFPTEVDIIAKDTKSCDIVATVLARNQPVAIKLAVLLDGQPVASPPTVNLNFDNHPLSLPVQNSQFTVPLDVVRAKSVVFSLSLPGEEISTTVDGSNFASENWTLRLADHKFEDDFQYEVPKGAKVKSSCVLTFESIYADAGDTKFDPHCRTIEKHGK